MGFIPGILKMINKQKKFSKDFLWFLSIGESILFIMISKKAYKNIVFCNANNLNIKIHFKFSICDSNIVV